LSGNSIELPHIDKGTGTRILQANTIVYTINRGGTRWTGKLTKAMLTDESAINKFAESGVA
jgi:hypothetical protein